jgi:hypothetical protein
MEAAELSQYLKHNARSLAQCTDKFSTDGHRAAAIRRRQDLAVELRQERGLESYPYVRARALDSILNKSHHSSNTHINLETAPQNFSPITLPAFFNQTSRKAPTTSVAS